MLDQHDATLLASFEQKMCPDLPRRLDKNWKILIPYIFLADC